MLCSHDGKLFLELREVLSIHVVIIDNFCSANRTAKAHGLSVMLEERPKFETKESIDAHTRAIMRWLNSFGIQFAIVDGFSSQLSREVIEGNAVKFLKSRITATRCKILQYNPKTGRWFTLRKVTIPRRKSHKTEKEYRTSLENARGWLFHGNPQPKAPTIVSSYEWKTAPPRPT